MSIRYLKIRPLKRTPPFRKLALGTWGRTGDPQIYGMSELDLTHAEEWIRKNEDKTNGPRITITHLTARAIALAMKKYPDLNGYIRFRKIYLRESVDIFFQVMTEHESGRMDLTGIQIQEADRKDVFEIAREMEEKVSAVRSKKNTELQKTARLFDKFPGWAVWLLLRIVPFISYTLNLKFPGIPRDHFGGCMISNVGGLGIDAAWAPLVPYSRVPLILILGGIKKRPLVVDDEIKIRKTMRICSTIDHRFCDGALLSKMSKIVEKCFREPDKYFSINGR